jgi:hypothetical protein
MKFVIGKQYRFKILPESPDLSEMEFVITGITESFIKIRFLDRESLNTIHKGDWDFFIEPEPIEQAVQGHSVLIHKFV